MDHLMLQKQSAMWRISSNSLKTWKVHNVFYASYLSPYKETVEHGPNFLEPPPNLIEGQPEWEVEAIVGMCHFGPKKKK
jgi:hypothetical protein